MFKNRQIRKYRIKGTLRFFLPLAIAVFLSLGITDHSFAQTALKCVYAMHTAGNGYLYQELTTPANYTIVTGDRLVYDVYWTSTADVIAVDLISTGGLSLRDNGGVDQNGQLAHPANGSIWPYAYNKWYHREITIPTALVGKIISVYLVACEFDGNAIITGYVRNIFIMNGSTTKVVIYGDDSSTTNALYIVNPETNSVTFSSVAVPTITLGTSPSVCRGTTSASLPYSATTGSPNQYSIDYDATANSAGFTDVALTTLPASPITLVVPSNPAAAVYNATITVKNTTTGCISTSKDFTVTITEIPAVPAVSNSGPICAGGTVNLTASGLAPAGQAINFSTGSFSYINVAHSSAYTLSTNSTVEAWIYPTSRGTGQPIIYNKENSYEAAIAVTGELQWAYNNTSPGWVWVGTGYIIPLNAWTHVAFVYDYTNSRFRTYVNGGLIHTYSISGQVTDPGNPFRIGNRGSNDPFYGSIDNVRIWNVARIASEIYNSMYLENPASTTNLVALYPLNGNANATVGTSGSLVNAGGASWITPTFYTYTWTGTNAPAASTNQTQTTGAMNTAGVYSYTVKASIGSCYGAASGSTTVTINGLPTFTVTRSNVSCFGGSDGSITVNILTGTAPYEYSSDNGFTYTAPTISTTHTFSGLNIAGSPYLIRVRDINTCVSQQTCP
jgi:hypothetical protein